LDNNETVDILVFGAHADDVELSCGGIVAHAVKRGQKVGIVDLTRGEMGTRGDAETRLKESQEASAILGASFRHRLDFGDGNLRTGRDEELQIIELMRRHKPSVVIAPYPDDRHPDHTRTGKIVTEASFYAGLRKIETGQHHHRPQAVMYYIQNYMFAPSFVVDVTDVIETKMKAIAAYRSQFYNPESEEPATMIAKKSFLQMIEARARHFGQLIGAEFGEPLVTKTPPRVDDIVAAYRNREV
jgi:N-acetylglucosamine malate deacetylase 1